MMNLAVSEENYLRADSLYRKLPPPRADTLQFLLAHAYQRNDTERQRELLAAYEKSTTDAPAIGAYAAVAAAYNPEAFDRLVEIALERNKLSGAAQQRAVATSAGGLVEQGRMREALALLRPHEAKYTLLGINRRINSPMYEMPREDLLALRERVLRFDSIGSTDTPAKEIAPQLRLYNLAVLSCRLREYPAAAAYAERLQQLPVRPEWKDAVHALATEVSAQIDIENGRPADGFTKLESIKDHPPIELSTVLRVGTPQILWKAEALFRAGRYADAQRYLENLPVFFGPGAPTRAWRLLRLAQVSDALGRDEDARLKYAQFLKLFEKADPEMQPLVTHARDRLAQLQRKAG